MKFKRITAALLALSTLCLATSCGESETSGSVIMYTGTTEPDVETTQPMEAVEATTETTITIETTEAPTEEELSENIIIGEMSFSISKEWLEDWAQTQKDDIDNMWIASDNSGIIVNEPKEISADELDNEYMKVLEGDFSNGKIIGSEFNYKMNEHKTAEITAEIGKITYKSYSTIHNNKLYGFYVSDKINGKKTIIGSSFDKVLDSVSFSD